MSSNPKVQNWADASKTYLNFHNSPPDKLRRELVDPILVRLIDPAGKYILDLGCGEGYFARLLKSKNAGMITGVDVAQGLVQEARRKDPQGDYRVYDVTRDETFEDNKFDVVICNMVLMDISDLNLAFRKIASFLKIGGKFIASIQNPYYTFPVGVWKRDIRDLLKAKTQPALKITNYFAPTTAEKKLAGDDELVKHFHWKLSEYINLAARNKLRLISMEEPKIPADLAIKYKETFLSTQLQQVPLFQVMEFVKF